MSVEVNVSGMKCGAAQGGLSCTYCYQSAVRKESGNAAPESIRHEEIQDAVLKAAGPDGFTVFGGEPLLAPLADLERLWDFGFKRFGQNGVQTSGRPIREEHLRAFKRYNVHVGFSIDGPGELNRARVAGSPAQTDEATEHSERSLRRCLADGIGTSLIVTLHRLNAAGDRLPRLLQWFRDLDAAGLKAARLHLLELDGPGGKVLGLSPEENIAVLTACHELESEMGGLRFDLFTDIKAKLKNPDAGASCVWNHCDPWTTPAVHGIEADGTRGLCQRVHKDGKQYLPADSVSNVRQVVLWSTPQEQGGCRGCRFFLQCGGQCPGTAIGGDWRKRSVDCPTWFALLERIEGEMLARGEQPASLRPGIQEEIENRVICGTFLSNDGHADSHGDAQHSDVVVHADSPHGDHGDIIGWEVVR